MRHLLNFYPQTFWPLVGFLIFFGLFVIFIGTTFLKSQKEIHSYLEKLPLEKDTFL